MSHSQPTPPEVTPHSRVASVLAKAKVDPAVVQEVLAILQDLSVEFDRATDTFTGALFDLAGIDASRALPLGDGGALCFDIWHDGDASTGLPGDIACVSIGAVGVPDDYAAEFAARACTLLAQAFGELWDTSVNVEHRAGLNKRSH